MCTPGFKTMVQFMFSGKETIVTSIQDLELLFEIFRLADKVAVLFSITLTIDKLYPDWQYISIDVYDLKCPNTDTIMN